MRPQDVTPVGRIVNRFASDFDSIDRQVPTPTSTLLSSTLLSLAHRLAAVTRLPATAQIADNTIGVFGSLFQLIAAFSVIIYTLPAFGLWLVPLLAGYYRIQRNYRMAAREMKRLNSVSAGAASPSLPQSLHGSGDSGGSGEVGEHETGGFSPNPHDSSVSKPDSTLASP